MVEQVIDLDVVFGALADSTRRDIIKRVAKTEYSITELARPYPLSFAAVAKHVSVLEEALLIRKRREGKQQIISINSKALAHASAQLEAYQKMWSSRFDALDTLLVKTK